MNENIISGQFRACFEPYRVIELYIWNYPFKLNNTTKYTLKYLKIFIIQFLKYIKTTLHYALGMHNIIVEITFNQGEKKTIERKWFSHEQGGNGVWKMEMRFCFSPSHYNIHGYKFYRALSTTFIHLILWHSQYSYKSLFSDDYIKLANPDIIYANHHIILISLQMKDYTTILDLNHVPTMRSTLIGWALPSHIYVEAHGLLLGKILSTWKRNQWKDKTFRFRVACVNFTTFPNAEGFLIYWRACYCLNCIK